MGTAATIFILVSFLIFALWCVVITVKDAVNNFRGKDTGNYGG